MSTDLEDIESEEMDSVNTNSVNTNMNSPLAPERRRRKISQVEPSTPTDAPVTETQLSRMLTEALANALNPIHERLDEIQESQSNSVEEASHFHSTLSKITSENHALQKRINSIEHENMVLKQRVITLESHTRRNNLRFHGLAECKGENPEELVLEFLCNHNFPYDPRAIERAHRLGPPIAGNTRPIIVKFNHFKDRELVWKALGHGIFPPPDNFRHVREDFPAEIEIDRSKLLRIARAASKTTMPGTQAPPRIRMVIDKLFINNQKITVNNMDSLPHNLKPATVFTPMNRDIAAFYTKNSPLSNHYPSTFKHKGEIFNCAEQFIMVEKARFCSDQRAVKAIMDEAEPVKQKALGKTLIDFDQNLWQASARDIILPGLISKFEQCASCKEMLLATGTRSIVEGNPHDTFFGVGVSIHSPAIWNPAMHKGKNVMGKMLVAIRDKVAG